MTRPTTTHAEQMSTDPTSDGAKPVPGIEDAWRLGTYEIFRCDLGQRVAWLIMDQDDEPPSWTREASTWHQALVAMVAHDHTKAAEQSEEQSDTL